MHGLMDPVWPKPPRPCPCGLTSYRNLSALVTCHTLYVVLTTWQSAVFLLNSRLTHFAATGLRQHPFFRSYGTRLPSSLTRFHSRALAQLCPPTCVGFRYGQPWEHSEVFLGSCFDGSGSAEASPSSPLRADRHFQSAAHLHRNVTSELNHSRCRNIKPALHRLRPSAST